MQESKHVGELKTRVVWKFILDTQSLMQIIEMPIGSEVLTAQVQQGKSVLWALVNPRETAKVPRNFMIVETGQSISRSVECTYKHISTLQFNEGNYILHVFESINL